MTHSGCIKGPENKCLSKTAKLVKYTNFKLTVSSTTKSKDCKNNQPRKTSNNNELRNTSNIDS